MKSYSFAFYIFSVPVVMNVVERHYILPSMSLLGRSEVGDDFQYGGFRSFYLYVSSFCFGGVSLLQWDVTSETAILLEVEAISWNLCAFVVERKEID